MSALRVLVVGRRGGSHIGGSLLRAAASLGLEVELCDINIAWRYGGIRHKLFWHLLEKRPVALNRFGHLILEKCQTFQPQLMITTGMSPLTYRALGECRNFGVRCVNFSTDDPFNPKMLAPWFLRALRAYDTVFTPRMMNFEQLQAHGCKDVRYLMFGYDPDIFFPETASEAETSDLFFAGNAEAERAQYIAEAVRANLNVRLHGSYWDRYPSCRGASRGHADVTELRHGIASCRIALCLVRHDNRDGHSMRSFEIPAVGACMLVEDTAEHRQIFGSDEDRVVYCTNPREMIEKAKSLLSDSGRRCRLRKAVKAWILSGRNTYADRLQTILGSF